MEATERSVGKRRTRSYTEFLRCLMCVLVVLGHADAPVVRRGLAVTGFLTISVVFTIDAAASERLPGRIRSVLWIWLAWCVPYACLVVARGQRKLEDPFGLVEPWMVWTGPSIHLWYLPALAAAFGLLFLLGDWARSTRGVWICAALAALAAFAVECGLPLSVTPLPQLRVWLIALATAVAVCGALPRALSSWWAILGAAAVLSTPFLGANLKQDSPALLLMVLGVVVLCRSRQPETPTWLAAAASLTAGIYLIHVLVLFGFRFIGFDGYALGALALLASAAVTAVARATRLRPLFP